MMDGWAVTLAIMVGFIVVTGIVVWLSARRWWDYLVILVIAGLLIKPVLHNVTGDISPYMPKGLFDGFDGKNQFIWVSIVATLCIPVVLAAVLTYVIGLLWKINSKMQAGR